MDIECRNWNSSQFDLFNWMYHRLTESVDQQVGRVLKALVTSGLTENTIIVFTSDHGEMNGSHNLILKNVMFEECQRVPLIFAGKGIRENLSDKTTLVCNGLDFLPTICDLAGIEIPKGLTGISLKPFLTGEGIPTERKYIITESYNASQITDGRYKYTVYELPGYPELLTDLKTNPGETVNYAEDKEYASIKAGLKKLLLAGLDKRKLTPLPSDRTIENIRAKERAAAANKKKNDEEKE
jgi:choline-sulfatase